jgi:hypothetical protein
MEATMRSLDSDPEPVRVKYYGLIWLTKRTYLILQIPILILCFASMVVVAALPPRLGLDAARFGPRQLWILDHLLWIVLLVTVLEILDTFFTLWRFAQKERDAERWQLEDFADEPSEGITAKPDQYRRP